MTTVFKKSLALIIAVVLCATAFIGCLTVNAEGSDSVKALSATVNEATITPGGSTNVTISFGGITEECGILAEINFADGITINSCPTDDGDFEGIKVGEGAINVVNNTVTYVHEKVTEDFDIVINVSVDNSVTKDSFDVTFGRVDIALDSDDNNLCNVEKTNGKITVSTTNENTVSANLAGVLGTSIGGTSLKMKFEFSFSGVSDTMVATEGGYGLNLYKDADTSRTNCLGTVPFNNNTGIAQIQNISFKNLNEKFAVVPFVKLQDGTEVLGEEVKVSYADYLVKRMNSTATNATQTKEKTIAKKMLDLYYNVYGGEELYDNQSQTAVLNGFDSTKNYNPTNDILVEDIQDFFAASAEITGNFKSTLAVRFDYSAYSGTGDEAAKKYGILAYRADVYEELCKDGKNNISKDTCEHDILLKKSTSYCAVSGLSFDTMSEQLVFVPYIIDQSDNIHYGQPSHISYANLLVKTLDAQHTTDASKIRNANIALEMLDTYELIKGNQLYNTAD